jgi:hypothetical protein
MLEVTKTLNVSGYSRIAESDAPYVYFSASISADGKRSVNYSVQNQEIFDANEKTFEADRKEFEEAVKKMA